VKERGRAGNSKKMVGGIRAPLVHPQCGWKMQGGLRVQAGGGGKVGGKINGSPGKKPWGGKTGWMVDSRGAKIPLFRPSPRAGPPGFRELPRPAALQRCRGGGTHKAREKSYAWNAACWEQKGPFWL